MEENAQQDGDEVHAELAEEQREGLELQDLGGDEEADTDGGQPAEDRVERALYAEYAISTVISHSVCTEILI